MAFGTVTGEAVEQPDPLAPAWQRPGGSKFLTLLTWSGLGNSLAPRNSSPWPPWTCSLSSSRCGHQLRPLGTLTACSRSPKAYAAL